MLSLPFTLLQKCLNAPLLLSASEIPYSERKKLRQLEPYQAQVVSLVQAAEANWLAAYWASIQAIYPLQDGRDLATFIGRYTYGLVRASAAHAQALNEREHTLEGLTPLVKLNESLNNRRALVAQTRDALARVTGSEYSLFPQALTWARWGQELFTKQQSRGGTVEPWGHLPTTTAHPVEDVAVEDYLLHLGGGNLLSAEALHRPSFLTLTCEVPPAIVLKAGTN